MYNHSMGCCESHFVGINVFFFSFSSFLYFLVVMISCLKEVLLTWALCTGFLTNVA